MSGEKSEKMRAESGDGGHISPIEPFHQVHFVIETEYLSCVVACSAPEGSWCRMACPNDCESWDAMDHEHELADHGCCLAVEWFDAEDALDLYRGPARTVHDGPIEVSFAGDYWEWCYAEATDGAEGGEK